MRYIFLVVAALIFTTTDSYEPYQSTQCGCGRKVSEKGAYNSVTSDGDFPNPRLTSISVRDGRQLLVVKYDFPNSKQILTPHTATSSDDGRTWAVSAPSSTSSEYKTTGGSSVMYQASDSDLLRRSGDDGRSWQDCLFTIEGLSSQRFAATKSNSKSASLHFALAAVDPKDANTIYGAFSIWVPSVSDPTHQDRVVYVPGVYVSHDAGDHWQIFASDLTGVSPNGNPTIGIDPSDTQRMIAHSSSGVVITTDGGKTWSAVGDQAALDSPAEIRGREEALAKVGVEPLEKVPAFTRMFLMDVKFDPKNHNAIYLLTNQGLLKTMDGGRSWCIVFVGDGLFDLRAVVMDASNNQRLFVGSRKFLWQSDDGGCTFRQIFNVGIPGNPKGQSKNVGLRN